MLNTDTGTHVGTIRPAAPRAASLSELAAAEYERADGDVAEATASLAKIIWDNDDIRLSVAEQVIKEVASSMVCKQLLADRTAIMRHAVGGAGQRRTP